MSEYTPTTDDIQRLVYEYGSSSTVKITWEDFNAWLAEVKAQAWDEGHTHCFHVENPHNPVKGNPYREETE